jgi:monodictyphenone polyketide synthase
MMGSAKILYFSGEIPQGDPEGDQKALFRKLKLLSKERDHVVLASLLECVTLALKEECTRLSHLHRELIPPFESVLDLTDHVLRLRKTPLGGAIERVLVLVFQLGSFVAYVSPIQWEYHTNVLARYHEAHPLEYNFTSSTSLIGRGSGLLSAAAIGLSPSITMVPSIAGDITRISFRFGLVVDQVCRSLEVSPDEINADGAWVYCVHGVGEKDAWDAVNTFNDDKVGEEVKWGPGRCTNQCTRHILRLIVHPSSTSTMPETPSV